MRQGLSSDDTTPTIQFNKRPALRKTTVDIVEHCRRPLERCAASRIASLVYDYLALGLLFHFAHRFVVFSSHLTSLHGHFTFLAYSARTPQERRETLINPLCICVQSQLGLELYSAHVLTKVVTQDSTYGPRSSIPANRTTTSINISIPPRRSTRQPTRITPSIEKDGTETWKGKREYTPGRSISIGPGRPISEYTVPVHRSILGLRTYEPTSSAELEASATILRLSSEHLH